MAKGCGRRTITTGLALALLIALTGCGAASQPAAKGATVASHTSSRGARIAITPGSMPLFVRVTFDSATTYDQASAILTAGPHPANPYPWTCDDPRTPTPPSPAELRAAFDSTHALYLSYPTWDQVTRIASSEDVVAVDGAALYMCP